MLSGTEFACLRAERTCLPLALATPTGTSTHTWLACAASALSSKQCLHAYSQ